MGYTSTTSTGGGGGEEPTNTVKDKLKAGAVAIGTAGAHAPGSPVVAGAAPWHCCPAAGTALRS